MSCPYYNNYSYQLLNTSHNLWPLLQISTEHFHLPSHYRKLVVAKSKMNNHLRAKDMFLKQKMKQRVSLVCLYQHRAFLTDLILISVRQESHHQQIVPTESTVLNKGWYNLKGRERTSGRVCFLSQGSVQLLLKRVFGFSLHYYLYAGHLSAARGWEFLLKIIFDNCFVVSVFANC